jgi:CRP/FNR family putative post-exponential-phase nitrogen-starvation transcriptional regulator
VEAITETICLSLPVAAVRKSAERNYRLFMYLCGRLGAKLRDRIIAASINLRYPVESRLASYLLASTDGEGWILGTDDLGELADFLGTSYRQLGRVVRRFRIDGILDSTRGRIRVLDRTKLKPLAGDLYVRSGSQFKPIAL